MTVYKRPNNTEFAQIREAKIQSLINSPLNSQKLQFTNADAARQVKLCTDSAGKLCRHMVDLGILEKSIVPGGAVGAGGGVRALYSFKATNWLTKPWRICSNEQLGIRFRGGI